MDIALRLALPASGLALVAAVMALAFFRPDLAGANLAVAGGIGVLMFLTIFLTWEKGNLLNFLNLGLYTALVAGSLVVVYLLAKNHPLSWDLTSDKIHSLSPQTSSYLARLPQPVKIVGFVGPEQREKAERLLAQYRNANPAMVRTEVYDLIRDKLAARRYDPNLYPGDFYVIREEARGGTENLGGTPKPPEGRDTEEQGGDGGVLPDEPGGEQTGKRKKVSLGSSLDNAESQLTNALVEILRDQTTKIYILSGHGEKPLSKPATLAPDAPDPSLSKLQRLLEERAFPCEELNLLRRGAIPPDAAIVVIPGPKKDLFDLERDMLSDYLAGGGKLFLLFDPVMDRNVDFPNLRALISLYGIQTPANAVVVDLASAQLNVGALTPIVQEFGAHKIMEGIPQQAFFLVEARPVSVADPAPPGVAAATLIKTGPAAWSVGVDEMISSGMRIRQPQGGTKPQPLAVAAEKTEPGATSPTRVVVLGDSDAFANATLESVTATLFFQACNWLAEQEDLLAIPPKMLSETPITLDSGGLLLLSFSLGLIVLVVLFGGLGYTVLRRKLG